MLETLGLPLFVKPARLGSSVGIVRVDDPGKLDGALAVAFEHDPVAIVEADARGREIECSVLGNESPIASEPARFCSGPARAVGMTTRPSTRPAGCNW